MNLEIVKTILNEINLDFKIHKAGLNFRCPVCGDSKKSKNKKRGWILTKNDVFIFYCFNECPSSSFRNFLKFHFPKIYSKYKFEFIKDSSQKLLTGIKESIVSEINTDVLVTEDLTPLMNKISFPIYSKQVKGLFYKSLQYNAIKYFKWRLIPDEKIKECFIIYRNYEAEDCKYFLKNRIAIPFYNEKKIMYAFQARALFPDIEPKYLTVKGKNKIKIYNYFNADYEKETFCLEGPINSFFVNNGIASSGTITVDSFAFNILKKKFKHLIWVFDNDLPGTKRCEKFLNIKENCFIWPDEWKSFKDLNDVVLNLKLTTQQISDIIKNNVSSNYKGNLELKFKLKELKNGNSRN